MLIDIEATIALKPFPLLEVVVNTFDGLNNRVQISDLSNVHSIKCSTWNREGTRTVPRGTNRLKVVDKRRNRVDRQRPNRLQVKPNVEKELRLILNGKNSLKRRMLLYEVL